MNEKLEGYKAELVSPQEVTNELILNGYLVGVYNLENNSVIIVKNELNGVTGEIPTQLWELLVDDLEALNAGLKKSETTEENNDEDEFFNEMFENLNPIFNSIGKSFDEIRPKAEKIQEEVTSKGNIIFSNFLKDFEKLTKDMQPRVQEVTEDIKEKIKTEAQRTKLILKRKRLENILDEAHDLGVATNGLIKKVNKKIATINDILGD